MYRKALILSLLTLLTCRGLFAQSNSAIFSIDSTRAIVVKELSAGYAVAAVADSVCSLVVLPIGPYYPPPYPPALISSAIKLDSNYTISDISVVGNYIFVCGTFKTPTSTSAWYGCANFSPSSGMLGILRKVQLRSIESVSKIVAYINPATLVTDIAMLAHNDDRTYSVWGKHYVVRVQNAIAMPTMFDAVILNADYCLYDLTVTERYVVATGEYAAADGNHFILRFDKDAASPFTATLGCILPLEYLYKHFITCTAMDGNIVAIAYFTMNYGAPSIVLRVVDVGAMINIVSHTVAVVDKIDPPQLTYIPTDKSVVMLFPDGSLSSMPPFSVFAAIKPLNSSPQTMAVFYENNFYARYSRVSTFESNCFIAPGGRFIMKKNELSAILTACTGIGSVVALPAANLTMTLRTAITGLYNTLALPMSNVTNQRVNVECNY